MKFQKANGKSSGTFYFKHFGVADSLSTMKVGTDAVLLGAIVEMEGADSILEIGTGCGVIALMLAQRSDAMIDAIDIDEGSVIQARENVEQSPWKSRIKVYHSSLQKFKKAENQQYDLIISNPPFFSRSLKSPNEKKNLSKHNDSLSFHELAEYSYTLMKPDASLWVILPARESEEFVEIAEYQKLFIHNNIKVFSKSQGCHYRNIIHLRKDAPLNKEKKSLFIKDENGSYTEEYKQLTKDFYLDF